MFKYIYKITNLINGKMYIGQTVNPKERFAAHQTSPYLVGRAIRKYGVENFSFEIIEYTEQFNERERYWIDFYNSVVPNGYNIVYGEQFIKFSQQEEIIKDLQQGLSYAEIQDKYKISYSVVSGINNGTKYYNCNYNYPICRFIGKNLTKEKVAEIEMLLMEYDGTMQNFVQEYIEYKRTILYIINAGKHKHSNKQLTFPLCDFSSKFISQQRVKEIEMQLKTTKKSLAQIAKEFNIHYDTVGIINQGKHTYSTALYQRIRKTRDLTKEEVLKIEELLKTHTTVDVCKIMQRSEGTVRKIKFGRHPLSSKPVETNAN